MLHMVIQAITKHVPHRRGGQTFTTDAEIIYDGHTEEGLRIEWLRLLRRAWNHTFCSASSSEPDNLFPSFTEGDEQANYAANFKDRMFYRNGELTFPNLIFEFILHSQTCIKRPRNHPYPNDPENFFLPTRQCKLSYYSTFFCCSL